MTHRDPDDPALREPTVRPFDSWRWAATAMLLGLVGASLTARVLVALGY